MLNVTLRRVTVKGMFNDILEQEPSLWELYDILCVVKWKLSYQVWNLQALGQTDFSDIIGFWQEALDEFKAAPPIGICDLEAAIAANAEATGLSEQSGNARPDKRNRLSVF